MAVESRPPLAFGRPTRGDRKKQKPRVMSQPPKQSATSQRKRLGPQFDTLQDAFAAQRALLSEDLPTEVDPELVVVFDLVSSVKDFHTALSNIEGMHFLTERIGEKLDDDDEYLDNLALDGLKTLPTRHLYLVMTNARAVNELISLFHLWQENPEGKLARGLNKFKNAFSQLRSIRKWGPEDRIRETNLRQRWEEYLAVVGQSVHPVRVEIEFWFRENPILRLKAEDEVKRILNQIGGTVISKADIPKIQYHAILAEVPIQVVENCIAQGPDAVALFRVEEIMFVSPFTPMTIPSGHTEVTNETTIRPVEPLTSRPLVALLDGYPFTNHHALNGRIIIDDPDGVENTYSSVMYRKHGTHMASLILHGDLSRPNEPLSTPLYIRPIMSADELTGSEVLMGQKLLPDLIHEAIRRIIEGDRNQPPVAPSVRVINLSIGAAEQSLILRVSPVGRLLDWLAVTYNLLFIVSAGNHGSDFTITPGEITDPDVARLAIHKQHINKSLLRGILPPGDAINVVTVGATYQDELEPNVASDTVWSANRDGEPAFYSATGPGPGRTIKPDIHHSGGRLPFQRPAYYNSQDQVHLEYVSHASPGVGAQVAAPRTMGALNGTTFTAGTSVATALVTREAARLFELLQSLQPEQGAFPIPDPQYHPLLVRALLVHASSWEDQMATLSGSLGWPQKDVRKNFTSLYGYGRFDPTRAGTAATNRALLLAGDSIEVDQCHTYSVDIPPSLVAKTGRRRLTVTLAYAAPTSAALSKYRTHKVAFSTNSKELSFGDRREADHNAVVRGSVQHEIFEGSNVIRVLETNSLEIHVVCTKDGSTTKNDPVRYALVVSIEADEEVSNQIYEEVRSAIQAQARAQTINRVSAGPLHST